MKYFVIFLILIATVMVTVNPISAQCAYDPSQPHKLCDDTHEFLLLDSFQTQIENINGMWYYVSEPLMSNLSVDKIVFHDVSFTLPYRNDPPRYTYSDIEFSDGTKETLSILFDEPAFTKHVSPQAGFVGKTNGYSFLISADLKELSPLKQLKSGIEPKDVVCKPGLELVMKKSNERPICVKGTSVKSLTLRGYIPEYNGALGGEIQSDEIVIGIPHTLPVEPKQSEDELTTITESFNKKYDAVIKGKIEGFMGHKETWPIIYQSNVEIITIYKTHPALASDDTITILAERDMVTEYGTTAILGLDYDKDGNYFKLVDRFVMDSED